MSAFLIDTICAYVCNTEMVWNWNLEFHLFMYICLNYGQASIKNFSIKFLIILMHLCINYILVTTCIGYHQMLINWVGCH
jgi:hypothetical protein